MRTIRLLALIALLNAADAVAGHIYIRVNQLGFRPGDGKVAIAFSDAKLPDHFALRDRETGMTVWTARAAPVAGSWGAFSNFADLDFSAFPKTGEYSVQFGDAMSASFDVNPKLYDQVPDQLLEFMREQRCGYNPFLNQKCHQFDGRTAYGPAPAATYLDCTGGWHDAGDLLKYLLTSGNATAQMLLAWQIAPNQRVFRDTVDASGRPGSNGVPDLLDEARWGLEWMLKLHPAPDVLYHQVADDRDHSGWRLPEYDQADYGWGKGSYRVVYCADGKPQGLGTYKNDSTGMANLAGRYAAAMSLAAVAFKERDPAFASNCLRAGVEVYALGKAHEGVQQGNCYRSPYHYSETTWADDMEWGAAALFAATGKSEYLTDAIHYAPLAGSESWMGKEQTLHYQYYPFVNAGHFMLYQFAGADLRRQLAAWYRDGIERCLAAAKKNPYRIGIPFIWCSNNLLVGLVTQCALYERMTGDRQYHSFMCRERDWLLGRNPWGTSMFTEIPWGGIYPRHPHLMTTQLTGRLVRGALVDGPVSERIFSSLKGVSLSRPDTFAPFQSIEAVYHDDLYDYSSNEPTMDGTASAILMLAAFPRD